jgi:hypothetical protein
MPPRFVRRVALGAAAVAVLVGAGCSSGSDNSANGTSAPATSGDDTPTSSTAPPTTAVPADPIAELASWSLPSALSRTACGAEGSTIRCASGLDANRTSSSAVLQIDPAAGSVQKVARIPNALHDAAGTTFGGRMLLIGGGESEVATAAVVDTSSTNPQRVGQITEPRSDVAAVASGDTLVVVGGYDDTSITAGVLTSKDGVSFSEIGQLVTPVRYPAVAALDGKVYAFGGKTRTPNGNDSQTADIQRIDPATGDVTLVGQFPEPTGHMVAAVLDGTIYVMGGRTGTGTSLTDSSAIWRFDPASGSVTPAGNLPKPVTDSTIAVVDGEAWLIGGERDGTPIDDVVLVRPAQR